MNSQAELQVDAAAKAATVGIFDSGIGGFTVAREILRLRPDLNLVYYGDSLNIPYGTKTPGQLSKMANHSIQFLKSQGIDILAVGCNASNSVLGQGDLKSFGLPVYDLVSSTIDFLKDSNEITGDLALVATEASINSGYWQRKLAEAFPDLRVLEIVAPKFVPLIESGEDTQYAIDLAVKQTLQVCLDQGVYNLLHGCTHFPLLQGSMQEFCADFSFIDPAVCLAKKLVDNLSTAPNSIPKGGRNFYCSLPSESFYQAGEDCLGEPIRDRTSMYIVNPFED